MSTEFPVYKDKELNLSQINEEVLAFWSENKTFEKSISSRKGKPTFVFYEGPPSANGKPGIHHVMARAIKDIFCRYKTMQGFLVERKAGWDTHGLPVELSVEKKLGITKDDIGDKISVEEYNKICREEVMKYTDIWEELTRRMGYWIDMDNPYITYDNRYIETVWWLLKELYSKGLLYKGHSIQPYSPAAGTGLSTHELNQEGCYRMVKDTTAVALFNIQRNEASEFLFKDTETDKVHLMAWTTTPWTLLSNTALAVGKNITYCKIKTINPYTEELITVVIAKDRMADLFPEKNKEIPFDNFKKGSKKVPFTVLEEFTGKELAGVRYEQLLPYQQPTDGDAFKVLLGDFVTTEEGTGIVHIAPSFGADDYRVCKQNGIGSLTLVDKQGKFIDGVGEFSGRFVKNEYDENIEKGKDTVDVDIAVKLKKEGKAFRVEKYEHSYPHCWRTDKPVLYYPLDAWFIKTTAFKERMIELNNTINWKPATTGSGRFGRWLENLVDWNLSRSRYWGTPLPIWVTEDRKEKKCIGSVAQLKEEIDKAVEAGVMTENPFGSFTEGDNTKENYEKIDLHRPFVDDIILVSPSGKKMYRESDLIDVWFDSGAMPYSQIHFPFENKENFDKVYPSDFIAEGVDQTRGWFFTLHAIAVMLFDSVAYKNIISNGLVLDAKGNKMSKRIGNMVNPFDIMDKYGADPMRWYMITNAQPWDNLKFDENGVGEVTRKFFGTLYNTYSFFALYANIDGFLYKEDDIPVEKRPEIDRWIISLLNTLIEEVKNNYENYEPTKAGRAIHHFVTENLSNWYVRLNRKRFWGDEYSENKIAAYQTLYTCLATVAKLMAPIAPFFADKLYLDLNSATGCNSEESVHLTSFPTADKAMIDKELEERMDLAQRISSMVLGLRRKVNIKVRQPLNKILIPVIDRQFVEKIKNVENIILTEINVKEIEFVSDASGVLVKKIKPNFKKLGPKYGKLMKKITATINQFGQEDIFAFEKEGKKEIDIDGETIELTTEDVEIISEDIPGWLVAHDGNLTVALDINVTDELRHEGIAREFINRIQNFRKESGFDVTDKITLSIQKHEEINEAVEKHKQYIGSQTLATTVKLVDTISKDEKGTKDVEIDDIKTVMKVENNSN